MGYTAGDWRVDKLRDGRVEIVSPSGEVVICQVFKVDQEANAQLIASAPDLYEACLTALGTLYPIRNQYSWIPSIMGTIQDALRRAEGK